MQVDLNCDMGESFGPWTMGDDSAMLELITSANVACGFHGGDPQIMLKTAKLAKEKGVAIGAHPGFHDIEGFGRRRIRGFRRARSRRWWPTRSARCRASPRWRGIASPM